MANNNGIERLLPVIRYSTEQLQTMPLGVDVAPLEATAGETLAAAKGLLIVNDETLQAAVDQVALVKRQAKEVDLRRVTYTTPLRILTERLNGLFMPILDTFKDAEQVLKAKIGNYHQAREQAALAEQEKRAAEYRKKVAAEEAKAKKFHVEPKYIPPPVYEVRKPTTRGGSGTATVKMVWKYEVTEEEKVPRQFCSPDSKKIRAAIDQGVRTIPGVRIWEEPTVAVR
jgi:hypothetical protein